MEAFWLVRGILNGTVETRNRGFLVTILYEYGKPHTDGLYGVSHTNHDMLVRRCVQSLYLEGIYTGNDPLQCLTTTWAPRFMKLAGRTCAPSVPTIELRDNGQCGSRPWYNRIKINDHEIYMFYLGTLVCLFPLSQRCPDADVLTCSDL